MIGKKVKMSGFHGTRDSCSGGIIKNGFNHSKKSNEWLGNGIYFFAQYDHADWWARKEYKRFGNVNDLPVVIFANINCNNDEFIDFDIYENMEKFEKEIGPIVLSFGSGGEGAPNFKDENELRCFCCNFYKKVHTNIKMMTYSFPVRSELSILGFPKKKRQYCINDNSIIIELKKKGVVDYVI